MSIRLEIVQAFDVMGNQIARAIDDVTDLDPAAIEVLGFQINDAMESNMQRILGILPQIKSIICPICGNPLSERGLSAICSNECCPYAVFEREANAFLQDAVAIAIEQSEQMLHRSYGIQARIAAKKEKEGM